MSEPASSEPGNLRSLQARLRSQAKREGALEGRVQRQLGTVVVGAMLERVDLGTAGPPLLVKGGSALELRLGLAGSRTSKDLDAVLRGEMRVFLPQVGQAVTEPLGGFTGRVERPEAIRVPGMPVPPRRFQVKLSFKGKPFVTVPVEVSLAEGAAVEEYDEVPAPRLSGLGLPELPVVPCLTVRYQVAQKLHACTDPLDGELVNTRARDLVDLLLLVPLLPQHLGPVREACLDVFSTRDRHAWPPALVVPDAWPEIYVTAAAGLAGLVPPGVNEAAAEVRGLIARVDSAC